MADDVKKVTVGKPKIGGSVYRAPIGTTLPTDATSTLNEAFKCLGYVSEDGLTNTTELETENIKEWGGATVLNVQTSKDDTWSMTLIEAMNIDVLKMVYGDSNVTGSLDGGIVISANNTPQAPASYVFEMIYNDNAIKRVVLPNAYVTEVGDITYVANEAVGYETTLTAAVDASGNNHYEYIVKQ